jgi:hypothetical protein
LGNIITSGNISPWPPRAWSLNDKFNSRKRFLPPQRASLKRASKAADTNFVLWVEIKIFYLAHCMTVPVNFNRGAARSGIKANRQCDHLSSLVFFY